MAGSGRREMAGCETVTPKFGGSTTEALVLLGWMAEAEAITYLGHVAVPAFTPDSARALWEEYRSRVEGLAPSPPAPLCSEPLDEEESAVSSVFLRYYRANPTEASVASVAKVDPSNLCAHQLQVISKRVALQKQVMSSKINRSVTCLPLPRTLHPIAVPGATRPIRISLPHAEFSLRFAAPSNQLQVVENPAHISAGDFEGKLYLWSGYHRAVAAASAGGGSATILVGITRQGMVSPSAPIGRRESVAAAPRPPTIGDFLNPRLACKLPVRNLRFEAVVEWRVVGGCGQATPAGPGDAQ